MSRAKGFKHSDETRRKMSASQKGRTLSEAHRKAISEAKLKSDKARGPNAYQWNPDRDEQRLKLKRSRVCYGFIGKMLGWIEAGDRDLDQVVPQLGYTCRQLYEHLEKHFETGMSWDNYGIDGWHIDHVRPISSFLLTENPQIVNALENLRPLWAKQNLSKGGRW